jgi:hypothetical protein
MCVIFGWAAALAVTTPLARAEEKEGLLVDVQKKVVNRNDKNTPGGVGSMTVDRTLSLKVDMKNNAIRDMPETKADYTVLIQRWAMETGRIERYEGTAKVDALAVGHTESVLLGEFHIGGHMHGSSEMHVDHMLAWKVVIERDGKKLEFMSNGSFDSMNKRAKPGSPSN